MKDIEYRMCQRCVMDSIATPEISFDENGYCNFCNEYIEKTSKFTYNGKESDQKLKDIVNKIKKYGKNNQYDCLIGISGGVDSCYTAYLAKKYNLRALLVHMDNGWDTENSLRNIENTVKILGFDYINYKLDWDEFRDLQLSFLKASVPEIETPTDMAILAVNRKIANEHNIKYIISGGNYVTEGILPKSWHYNVKDYKYIKSIHKQYGEKDLKNFPIFDYRKEIYYKFIKGIRIIYILNYIKYNPNEAMKTLQEELDWQNYNWKHYESLYTQFVQKYILPAKFNIDYRKATLSTMICSGLITRDEALEILKEKPYTQEYVDELKPIICKKLNITTDEFNEIMQTPPKTYKEFKNSKNKLECIYKIYRKFFTSYSK